MTRRDTCPIRRQIRTLEIQQRFAVYSGSWRLAILQYGIKLDRLRMRLERMKGRA